MTHGTDYPHDWSEPEEPRESRLLTAAMDAATVLLWVLAGIALAIYATHGAD